MVNGGEASMSFKNNDFEIEIDFSSPSNKGDYTIVAFNKCINPEIDNNHKKLDTIPKKIMSIIEEVFTNDNIHKYSTVTRADSFIKEKLYLPTFKKYIDIMAIPQTEVSAKFIISFQEKLENLDEYKFIKKNKQNIHSKATQDLIKKDDAINNSIDVASLKLQDLVDLKEINKLMGIFNNLYNIPVVIVDLEGYFLTSVGMSEICANFHRVNPITRQHCIDSDVHLSKGLKKNEIRLYKCFNNMHDLTSPIYVGGRHIANFFIGQFFLDDEEVDYDLFKKQAEKYGFDKKKYLTALDKIPRIGQDKIKLIITFYQDLLNIIMTLAHSKLNLLEKNHNIKLNEEKLQQITDNMTDVVFTADLDFNINFISPSIEKLTGYTPSEYKILSMEERYPPLAVEEIKETISLELKRDPSLKNTNRSNINMLAMYNKQKKIVFTSIHSKFLRNKNDEAIGIIANIRDITNQIKAEKKLEKQLKLQSLLSSIAVKYINISTKDIDNSINSSLAQMATFVNADRAYIFRYDWEKQISINTYEWVAQGITEEKDNLQEVPLELMDYWPETHKKGKTIFIDDLDRLNHSPNVQKILRAQDVKSLITIPLMKENHCVGFVGFDSVQSQHIYSDSEQTMLSIFAELLVNISNRIELETNLRTERMKAQDSDILKSNLLKNISHEFRTPLNGIIGFSELLQQRSNDFETGNTASMIYSSAIRLNHVLDSIMLLTQLEDINKKNTVKLKPTNLSNLLTELASLYKEQFNEKSLTFYSEIEPNLYTKIDSKLLSQAIIQLLNNALKFTHKGGIQLTCTIMDNNIIIEVIDSGIGIPNEYLKIIFKEFRQASEGYNWAYEGVGLGLTIAKRIIDLMQGEISVESKILSGSTFTIKLPLIDLDTSELEMTLQHKEIPIPKSNTAKPKILVVEDNVINQKLVTSILKNDYTIDLAINGEVAVQLAEKKKYDSILMDIHLGEGIDGLTATRIIKSHSKNITTPIIAVTGYTMIGDKDRILAEGCSYYIAKPYKKIDLLNTIQQAINPE